jgi:hypothetical protein
MRDSARHAKTALTVYLERGRSALEALRACRYDEATALLQKRSAAFHNFRAVDALAQAEGEDLAKDAEVLRLWQELRTLEKELAVALETARSRTADLFQKIRAARAAIGAFHSGRSDAPRFTRTA